MVSDFVREYVEREIIPLYDSFDRAHDRTHVNTVIEQSAQLATHFDVNYDMVYLIAAFHDTGLGRGRELHHIYSSEMLMADKFVAEHFDAAERKVMAEAIEDHRASSKHDPRTIYGKIVAEADRVISVDITLERTVQYGLKHYPKLDMEAHYVRFEAHLQDKYARGGYVKLWIPYSDNARNIEQLRAVIEDKPLLRKRFLEIYDREYLAK
ncbi:MAG: HD domain-containing protein [Rikenellaceae bacterium]